MPAYLSNGVVELRVPSVPFRAGVAMVNGVTGRHPALGVEYSPEVPYPLAGDLSVDGVRLSDRPDAVWSWEQRYDFATGELHSAVRIELASVELDIRTVTFASRTIPSVVAQEHTIVVGAPCRLTAMSLVSTAAVPGRCLTHIAAVRGADGEVCDGMLRFEQPGGLTSTGIAAWTELDGGSDVHVERPAGLGNGDLATSYDVACDPRRAIRLRQLVAMVLSTAHGLPEQHAARIVDAAGRLGFDELRRRNADVWAELWQGRVRLVGADVSWQARSDAAFFYMTSSVHRSSPASTSIFGLARWRDYHYYYGHVMWDIEAFSIPPLLLVQPDAARALLGFRSRTVDAAKVNARMHGRLGLQFPWEAGAGRGDESAPLGTMGPTYEDHISFVVAAAFDLAASATGDDAEADDSWTVVAGVANWLVSRGVRTARGFEIRRAMGIAERSAPADNDVFTNLAAASVLRSATAMAHRLGRRPALDWTTADAIVLCLDETGALLPHDGFDPAEDKAETPSGAAAQLFFDHDVAPEVASATRRQAIDRAAEYVGSPMLASLLGVFAAHEGDRARSAELFEAGYARYCTDRFANVLEYRPDRFPDQMVAGPFFANLSGFLLGCVFGLGHLRIGPEEPSHWCRPGPIVMPDGWDGVEIDRVWARNRRFGFAAHHGDQRARLEPLD